MKLAMKKTDLEHIIRAAAAITNQYEVIVIGSQSILGSVESPPQLSLGCAQWVRMSVARLVLQQNVLEAAGRDAPALPDWFGWKSGITGWVNRRQ